MDIKTLAKINEIEVLKPGTYHGVTFSSNDIDDMISAFEECQPFIQESIAVGQYRDNPGIILNKPVPGLVNLGHQAFLPETIKNAVRDVAISLKKKGEWLVATLDNLKPEIAEFIKDRFNWRSIEFIPSLFNPLTGKTYKNVLRSIGFLPPDMPPAVSGQNPSVAVEFAETGILTVFLNQEQTQEQGANIMPIQKDLNQETQANTMPIQEDLNNETQANMMAVNSDASEGFKPTHKRDEAISAIEFARIEQQIQAMKADMSKMNAEKEILESRLNKSEVIRENQEIMIFCDKLIHEFDASKAFVELIRPYLDSSSSNNIIEFGETSMSQRDAAKDLIVKIIQMASNNSLFVPIGEYADHHADDPSPKMTKLQKQEQMIAEFTESAKSESKDPNNEREVFQIAYKKAIDKYGKAFE